MKITSDLTTSPGNCILTATQEGHANSVTFPVDANEEAPPSLVTSALHALARSIKARNYSGVADLESELTATSAN